MPRARVRLGRQAMEADGKRPPRLPGFRCRPGTPARGLASGVKLLFDENPSPRLVQALEPEYPGSAHMRILACQLSFLDGVPPKIIRLSGASAGTDTRERKALASIRSAAALGRQGRWWAGLEGRAWRRIRPVADGLIGPEQRGKARAGEEGGADAGGTTSGSGAAPAGARHLDRRRESCLYSRRFFSCPA